MRAWPWQEEPNSGFLIDWEETSFLDTSPPLAEKDKRFLHPFFTDPSHADVHGSPKERRFSETPEEELKYKGDMEAI